MSSGVFGADLIDSSGSFADPSGGGDIVLPTELCTPPGKCYLVEEIIEWGTHFSVVDISFGDVDNTDADTAIKPIEERLSYTRQVFTKSDMIIDDVVYPPYGTSTATVNVPSSAIGGGAAGAEAEVWVIFNFGEVVQAYHMTIKNPDAVTTTTGGGSGGGRKRTTDGDVIEETEIIEVVELPEVEGRLIYTGTQIFFESYDTPDVLIDLGPAQEVGQVGLIGAGLGVGSQWAGFFLFDHEADYVPYDWDAAEISDPSIGGLYDPFNPVQVLTVSTSSSTHTSSKPAKNDTNKTKECECTGSAWAIVECKGKWSSSKVNEVNSGLDANDKPIWTVTVTQDKWTWTNSQTGEQLFGSPNTNVADMNSRVEKPVDSCPGDGCKTNQDCLLACQAAAAKKVNDEIEKLKGQCEGGDVFVISSGNKVGGVCKDKCEEKEGGTDTSSSGSSSSSSSSSEDEPEPTPKRAGICWCSIKAEKYGYCHDEGDDLEDEDWKNDWARGVIDDYRAAGSEYGAGVNPVRFDFDIPNYAGDDRYTGSGYSFNHVPVPNPLPAGDGGTVAQTMYISPPLPVLGGIPVLRGWAKWSDTLLSIVKFTYEFEGYTGSCDPDEKGNKQCEAVCTAKYQNGLKGLIAQKQEKCKGDWYPPNDIDNEPDTDADNLNMGWFCKAIEEPDAGEEEF
ncbi:hypothetical protein ACFLZB_02105 [Nanoarchaeota archaeon]